MSAGKFAPLPALAALLGALLLQIGSNLANDVFDYLKGSDTHERLGPLRVTQARLLTPRQVIAGMVVVFLLAALCGVYLIVISGWPVLVIGLAAILTAVIYTGGPFPLGYHGLGELAVFIFFGPAAVIGTYYVQALHVSPAAVWASLPMGLLTVGILVINNLRDIETDRVAGKRTLAVRFGAEWARREYAVTVGAAYLLPLLMVLSGAARPWVLLCWASLPRYLFFVQSLYRTEGRALNRTLGEAGMLELVYGLFFGLGFVLQPLLG